jgi:5-methyltetrahydrofolate--homocysteine methyltransferase
LNYIPAQDQPSEARVVKDAIPKLAPAAVTPANDVASHPPGCTCAVHLAWRKKAATG